MTGNGAVLGLGRPFADERFGCDVCPGLPTRASTRCPQCTARAKAQDQLALERSAALNVERLVDRLVADAHGLIIREVELDPVRYLLRTPRLHPRTVLAVRLVPSRPHTGRRTRDRPAAGRADLSGQSLLDIRVQPRIGYQLRRLRAACGHVGLPLRDRRPVVELSAPGGRVASQLSGDRPWVTADVPGGLTHALALGLEKRDLFTLTEGQVPARRRRRVERSHAATLPEPACGHCRRHTNDSGGFLGQKPFGDLRPERRFDVPLILRMPRGPQLRTHRSIRCLLTTNHPALLQSGGVATIS